MRCDAGSHADEMHLEAGTVRLRVVWLGYSVYDQVTYVMMLITIRLHVVR